MRNDLIRAVALTLVAATGVIMLSGCEIFDSVIGTTTTTVITTTTTTTTTTTKIEEKEPTWDTVEEGALLERPRYDDGTVVELLRDLNFSRGFSVTLFHSNSSNGNRSGELDYAGDKADGECVWTMAQWGCTHDMVSDGEFERDGSVMTYRDGGKLLRVDSSRAGCVTLGIKGSEEYTRDEDGNVRERTDITENWPHILIEQSVNSDTSNCEHIYMEIDYKVTKCESLVDRELYPIDTELNAAQFQWFITLTDMDPDSESYGSSMWFGFSMFDTRALNGTPSGFASYDGGKEDSTGLFIYMLSLQSAAQQYPGSVNSVPTSVVGKDVSVKVDILPYIKQALKIARQNGAMKGASIDKLKIGSTNIGWEIPGNYDCEVEISYLNMYKSN